MKRETTVRIFVLEAKVETWVGARREARTRVSTRCELAMRLFWCNWFYLSLVAISTKK